MTEAEIQEQLEAKKRAALYSHLRRVYPHVKMWVSPSSVETFWLCRRKWAFRYIEKQKQKKKFSTELGTLFHLYREKWLTTGEQPPKDKAGRLAKTGLQYLPPPGVAAVEQAFAFPTTYGVGFTGKIDFQVSNQPGTQLWGEVGVPLIGDHKTTSDEQYIKTPETLATKDPQGILYTAAAFLAHPQAQQADLHWDFVLKTSTPKHIPVRVRVTRELAKRTLPIITESAIDMLTLKNTPGIKANDVSCNASACGAFGGCDYADICKVSPQEKMAALFEQAERPYIPSQHPGGHP